MIVSLSLSFSLSLSLSPPTPTATSPTIALSPVLSPPHLNAIAGSAILHTTAHGGLKGVRLQGARSQHELVCQRATVTKRARHRGRRVVTFSLAVAAAI